MAALRSLMCRPRKLDREACGNLVEPSPAAIALNEATLLYSVA